ncbi:MAG: hypothetical protein A2075_18535 [Geobacteraceae bacterium GWC2_58_44]|nr:MAG: hypothetical protein A2075_18535 [Geobacteraceae bacterium GWC2_58_44]HBG04000.1 hypothetical protein [Geobacter sp.]
MSFEAVVIVIFAGVIGVVVYRKWIARQALLQAAEISSKMYAVWAEMGPYGTGAASANAMHYAYAAIYYPKAANLANIVDPVKHAEAYDRDPSAWEKLRQNVLSGSRCKGFDDQLGMARGMAALDDLNPGMFRQAGFQASFEGDANGNLVIVHRDLETGQIDTRFKDHDEAMAYAVVNDIGYKLLRDESFAAEMLLEALKTIYSKDNDKDMETAYDLGALYLSMAEYSETNPELEFSKMFSSLHNSWLESKGESAE